VNLPAWLLPATFERPGRPERLRVVTCDGQADVIRWHGDRLRHRRGQLLCGAARHPSAHQAWSADNVLVQSDLQDLSIAANGRATAASLMRTTPEAWARLTRRSGIAQFR
jgi:hypothetical protein